MIKNKPHLKHVMQNDLFQEDLDVYHSKKHYQ